MAFSEAKIQIAILETGLGGRLDATTAANAEIAAITRIDLACEAQVPGIDNAKFQEVGAAAKKGCPISKLFTGAQINLDAKLV